MASIFDYLTWRGDLSFAQDPVNPVDALVFSALSYIHYHQDAEPEGTLRQTADRFLSGGTQGRFRVKTDLELLATAANTRRFGQTQLVAYRDIFLPDRQTQFAAMTFLLDDGSMYLVFRGTDNTLVGWKEDFNMAFQQTVPSQLLAAEYTREMGARYARPMRLGGHSKGGNLAVFAAAKCDKALQGRIREVYNLDGPGFSGYLMGDPGYTAMVPKIHTYVPQSSVIGMLLEHEEPYTVIRSKSLGIMQHDLYTWELQGPGLIQVEEVDQSSVFLDATIKAWCAGMTDEERGRVVDLMYGLLTGGDAEHPADLLQPRNLRGYIKALSADEDLRRLLTTEFQGLMEAAKNTLLRLEGGAKPPALGSGEEG